MGRRTADAPRVAAATNTNGVLFWPVVVCVVFADLATKAVAAYALEPAGFPHVLVGSWLRLTLVYNPGAAFGLHLGPWSRGIFLVLTAVVVRGVWQLYRATPDRANGRVFALALLTAGAIGNALTRILSADGVIDFVDLGVGAHRWPTFNLADVAVTVGAVLLCRVLWGGAGRSAPAGTAADLPLGTSPSGLA